MKTLYILISYVIMILVNIINIALFYEGVYNNIVAVIILIVTLGIEFKVIDFIYKEE